jgi:hypothetical protein
MTITKLDAGTGDTLGFEVSGDVTTADYEVLTPAVAEAVDEHGTIRLLLDLTDFHWEKVSAWGSDLRFGHEYHDTIERLAIVGNRTWQKHLAHLASPFYAEESAFFETRADAWTWLKD